MYVIPVFAFSYSVSFVAQSRMHGTYVVIALVGEYRMAHEQQPQSSPQQSLTQRTSDPVVPTGPKDVPTSQNPAESSSGRSAALSSEQVSPGIEMTGQSDKR